MLTFSRYLCSRLVLFCCVFFSEKALLHLNFFNLWNSFLILTHLRSCLFFALLFVKRLLLLPFALCSHTKYVHTTAHKLDFIATLHLISLWYTYYTHFFTRFFFHFQQIFVFDFFMYSLRIAIDKWIHFQFSEKVRFESPTFFHYSTAQKPPIRCNAKWKWTKVTMWSGVCVHTLFVAAGKKCVVRLQSKSVPFHHHHYRQQQPFSK